MTPALQHRFTIEDAPAIAESQPRRMTGVDWRIAAVLVAVYVLIALAVCTRLPRPWFDEVYHADPAIRMVLGKGFTSGGMYNSGHGSWAGYPPLYHYLLAAWIQLIPASLMFAVRSFVIIAAGFGALLLYRFLALSGLIQRTRSRALLLASMLGGYGFVLSIRGGRHDSLGFLILTIGLNAFLVRNRAVRLVLMTIASATLVWRGFPEAIYAGILAALLILIDWRRYRFEAAAIIGGVMLGAMTLAAFHLRHGTLTAFTASTVGANMVLAQRKPAAVMSWWFTWHRVGALHDPQLVFGALMAAIVVLQNRSRLGRYALLLSVATTTTFLVLGNFESPYSWMAYLPLLVILFQDGPPRRTVWLARCGVILAAVFVFAGTVTLALRARPYDELASFIRAHVPANSHVYANEQAYYALAGEPVKLHPAWYAMSVSDRAAVNLAVVSDHDPVLFRTSGPIRPKLPEWQEIACFGCDRPAILRSSNPLLEDAPVRIYVRRSPLE